MGNEVAIRIAHPAPIDHFTNERYPMDDARAAKGQTPQNNFFRLPKIRLRFLPLKGFMNV